MKKVGFTCSCFDLFHAGHIMMLKEAKAVCDYLIVGLQTDPTIDRKEKNKPIQSVFERFVQLQACKYVDEILVYHTEEDLANLIMTQTMHIRFLGEEYKNKDFTGKQYCIENGIELYYHVRNHSYSTSELRQRTYELELQKRNEPAVVEYEQHSPKLLNKYYEGKTQ